VNKVFFSVVNPMVITLLRSPLHPLMSANTALIEFRGRKSGKIYQMPVSYHETEHAVHLFTDRSNGWWRNLQGGDAMKIRIRGIEHIGRPQVEVEDSPAKQAALTSFLTAVPRDASSAGVHLDTNGQPCASDIADASERLVLIAIDLMHDS